MNEWVPSPPSQITLQKSAGRCTLFCYEEGRRFPRPFNQPPIVKYQAKASPPPLSHKTPSSFSHTNEAHRSPRPTLYPFSHVHCTRMWVPPFLSHHQQFHKYTLGSCLPPSKRNCHWVPCNWPTSLPTSLSLLLLPSQRKLPHACCFARRCSALPAPARVCASPNPRKASHRTCHHRTTTPGAHFALPHTRLRSRVKENITTYRDRWPGWHNLSTTAAAAAAAASPRIRTLASSAKKTNQVRFVALHGIHWCFNVASCPSFPSASSVHANCLDSYGCLTRAGKRAYTPASFSPSSLCSLSEVKQAASHQRDSFGLHPSFRMRQDTVAIVGCLLTIPDLQIRQYAQGRRQKQDHRQGREAPREEGWVVATQPFPYGAPDMTLPWSHITPVATWLLGLWGSCFMTGPACNTCSGLRLQLIPNIQVVALVVFAAHWCWLVLFKTPTPPSVASPPTCSSPMSSAKTSAKKTLVWPSDRLARFLVRGGRLLATSSVPPMRPRLLPTRSVMRMRSRLTTWVSPQEKDIPTPPATETDHEAHRPRPTRRSLRDRTLLADSIALAEFSLEKHVDIWSEQDTAISKRGFLYLTLYFGTDGVVTVPRDFLFYAMVCTSFAMIKGQSYSSIGGTNRISQLIRWLACTTNLSFDIQEQVRTQWQGIDFCYGWTWTTGGQRLCIAHVV